MRFLKKETERLTLIDFILPKIENKTLALLKEIVLILSFAFLTGICAKLKIEIGLVPITMQTFAVLLSGALLGKIRGALSQITYLFLGLAGLPFFTRGGGLSYIMSPTFGYIIGFVLASFFVGWLCERGFDRKIKTLIFAMILGNLILYLPGLLWLAKFIGFERVLKVGFYPFLIGDVVKILLVCLSLPFFWQVVKKYKKEF